MVLIPAIGQRIQDVRVNDDHELNRLPAEALSKQLIGSPGHSGPPAFCSLGYEGAWDLTDCSKASPDLPAGSRGSGAG